MTANILIVEDDEETNQLLCTNTEETGYDAQPAYSGTEAMLHVHQRNWDVILLDLMIPGKSGEQILKEIQELSDVPIIISAKEE